MHFCDTCNHLQNDTEFFGDNTVCNHCLKGIEAGTITRITEVKRAIIYGREGVILEKWCNQCQGYKLPGAFHKSLNSTGGLAAFCKECFNKKYRPARSKVPRNSHRCVKCGEVKPRTAFRQTNRTRHYCMTCWDKKWSHEAIYPDNKKFCPFGNHFASLDEFSLRKSKTGKFNPMSYCRKCTNTYYKNKNKEKRRLKNLYGF
jgi:hypothetical protein